MRKHLNDAMKSIGIYMSWSICEDCSRGDTNKIKRIWKTSDGKQTMRRVDLDIASDAQIGRCILFTCLINLSSLCRLFVHYIFLVYEWLTHLNNNNNNNNNNEYL